MGMKHLIRTTASVDGVPLGEFKSFSGGRFTSGAGKSVSGAGQAGKARAGRKTVEPVTIGREDDGSVDLVALAEKRGKKMTVKRQPLDDDLNPRGKGTTYTGILQEVGPGDGDAADDSGSTDDFELVMLCDDVVS